jgi:hypothetical protein
MLHSDAPLINLRSRAKIENPAARAAAFGKSNALRIARVIGASLLEAKKRTTSRSTMGGALC